MADMPKRIWADDSREAGCSSEGLDPFGIWWHDKRPGYAEYVRADLHETLRRERDEARAEAERLREAFRRIAYGPWSVIRPDSNEAHTAVQVIARMESIAGAALDKAGQ